MTPGTKTRNGRDDPRDDALLVSEVAGGSGDALAALYRRHREAVHRVAYRLTGTVQDAEDVLQDVFVGLARALERYEERGTFGAWLLTVTARTALMRVRRRIRHPSETLEALPPPPADRRTHGDDVVDRLAVQRALRTMPGTLRRVFLLKEVEGHTHSEIAGLLDISVQASRVRLHRAWRHLDEQVEERP